MKKSPVLFLVLSLFILGAHPTATSAPLSLSSVPLYLGGAVDPNIMFIIDDSGSMFFEVTPDDLAQPSGGAYAGYVFPRPSNVYAENEPQSGAGYSRTFVMTSEVLTTDPYAAQTRSNAFNTNYYNPATTYLPWVYANGSTYPNAIPACAWHNPEKTGTCPTGSGTAGAINDFARDLTRNNGRYNTNRWQTCNSSNVCTTSAGTESARTFWPATYYTFNGGDEWNISNFTRTEIRTTTATYSGEGRINRTDCSGGVCTYEQEIQNFANWYTYHRSRILASRAGIGRAFAQQGPNMRVGYGTINKTDSTIDGQSNTSTIVRGVRPFTGENRTAFFDELYTRDIPSLGTPLRKALDDAGLYFSRTDDRGPWSTTPGSTGGEDLICRQSYTILMTDGYWSSGTANQATTAAARENVDNATGPLITGPGGNSFQYTPTPPYNDNQNNTLADIAMYYWSRDLRPDLVNSVPPSAQNEAFWQHMVTFGVAFGLTGSVDADAAWAAVNTGATINWPDTAPNSTANCSGDTCLARLDDLLHASINSRGGFFSAQDPDTFATELSGVLSNIADRTSSASSVALNSGSISSDSRVFQARFNSGDWSGQLLAFPIDPDDGSLLPQAWDARNLIPAANARTILTYDGNQGQPFRWANISADQQTLLGNQATLDYIRGDQSNELSNGGTLRNRSFLLGDIINSAPAFVAAPAQRYRDNWGAGAPENTSPYSSFREANKTRTPVVYVGANDGMLHAFNANTGAEIFGYVPSAVYDRLPDLTNPNYNHLYYVDGSPTVVDAFVNGSWRTILVSGLAGGGQGMFALDVTNPNDFLNEGTAANRVLWEFTDEDDRDMGYTYGQPSIVRLQNGDWAALFSGGYNNTVDNAGIAENNSLTGNATLYLVNLEDGSLIRKFDTQMGTAEDPTGGNRPNGLASPAAVDVDGDFIVDQIYVGDLFGNMWKIDVSSSNPNNWDFAYGDTSPEPLFTACFGDTCGSDNVQPITTRPQVVRHPTSNGFLVIFGTGKYFEVGDNSSSGEVTQSLYAIWDKAEATLIPIGRSDLLQQEIIAEVNVSGSDYRVTSDTQINWNEKDGWFIDLLSPGATNNFGERQVSNSIIRNGKLIFTTLLPSDDPCEFGGTGWLMELDFASGARLQYSPFDINDDGSFDSADFICIANCELDADGNPSEDRVLVPASGKKSEVGIIPTPSIASEAGGQREYKYTSGSSGEIEVTVENPGPGFEGRQSWRQLEFNY